LAALSEVCVVFVVLQKFTVFHLEITNSSLPRLKG